YLQLARDAQSSGDPVMAESYLQHAEHYYRLIATAMAAQQAALPPQPGQPPRPAPETEFEDDEDDVVNDRFASVAERLPQPQFQQPQFTPPPGYQERQPYNGGNGGQPGQERQDNRQEGRQDRPDRPPRHERPYNDRNQQGQGFNNRDNRRFRDQRPPADGQGEARPQDETRVVAPPEGSVGLPAFITAPAPRPLPADAPQPDLPALEGDEQQEAGGYHLRPRRRRRTRPAGLVGADAEGGEAPADAGGSADGE
ncbi:MAG TPA: DUF4167 domain-containing protein, partial [Rhodoblastus sp.]|nr:DUF4167 domain-containing protein [Rhodoblastus sp.]